ncbi:hypothetical protein K466DRAFT_580344, partial [Polyporus arcularius HHB13444]
MSRHVDFIVRREKVQRALEYKIAHDPNYAGFQIDLEALSQLMQRGRWTLLLRQKQSCPQGRRMTLICL